MEELLTPLGLSSKEALAYQVLLDHASVSASKLALLLKESRTNTYMILERLHQKGLVVYDDGKAVRSYQAADPIAIQKLWHDQQKKHQDLRVTLSRSLPELQSQYRLSQVKPGVVYLEGLDGLKTMLNDMAKSAEDIMLIPSYTVISNKEAFTMLQKGLLKRKFAGLTTLAVFHEDARKTINVEEFAKRNVTVRFWGQREYSGEMAVYGDKVVFTAYEPTIVNTIITNPVIAETMRSLFYEVWEKASE